MVGELVSQTTIKKLMPPSPFHQLPVVLKFSNDITVKNLVQNQAAWHKSCHEKFSNEKLERARVSKMQDKEGAVENSISGVKPHQC